MMRTAIAYIRGLVHGVQRRITGPYDDPYADGSKHSEAEYDAYCRGFTHAMAVVHPRSPQDPQFKTRAEERDYERFNVEQEREYAEEQRTGYALCPKCGERKLKKHSRYTRQYGGGYDTFEKCENESCDYAEVYV